MINNQLNSYQTRIKTQIDELLQQLKTSPHDTEILLELGLLYSSLQDDKNSKKYFKKALKINPNLYEIYYYLGNKGYNQLYFPHLYKAVELAQQQNDHAFANMVLERIADYYEDWGWEHFNKNPDKAKSYFKKAIKIFPNHADAHNGIGNSQYS